MSTERDATFVNDKAVYDITPFTHLDYPGKLAAIAWLCGCNMRCAYCYNDAIVHAKEGRYDWEELYEFLRDRRGLLDGVVISGGEATMHPLLHTLPPIKEMGFSLKLDTNGSNPQLLGELIEKGLVDYVALDYKAPLWLFGSITKSRLHGAVQDSLRLLLRSSIPYEVRTTVHADLLGAEDIEAITNELEALGHDDVLYLQEFVPTQSNIGGLEAPKKVLEKTKLADSLHVLWRN